MIKIDFIIISFNTKLLTIQCINSLYSSIHKLEKINTSNFDINKISIGEVIIVDNGSTDGTIEEIKSSYSHLDNLKLIENIENFGYAKACNIGIKYSKSEYYIISNSDIIVYPSSILGIIKSLTLNNVTIAGVQQLFPNFTWQRSWGYLPSFRLAVYNLFGIELILNKFKSVKLNKYISKIEIVKLLNLELKINKVDNINNKAQINVPYLDGAFLGFNRSLMGNDCYFDEDFFFYTEELELCYRVAKNGKNVVFNPNYYVIHYRGSSVNIQNTQNTFNPNSLKMLYETKLLFCKKHLSKLLTRFYFFSEFSLFYHLYILSLIFGFTKIGSKKEIYHFLMKINLNNLKKI